MDIDSQRFLELQYETLRKEIEVSKSNMFRLVVGGGAVVPTAQYLANAYSIGTIMLVLPLVVVVMVMLFLSENHAMMRAGTYIKEEIETHVEGIRGWETWLNSPDGNKGTRTVDKLLVLSFSILAACYFMVSVILAARYALKEFGENGQYLTIGIYVAIGVVLMVVVYMQARTDTVSIE